MKEVTPKHLRCTYGPCPAVHSDGNKLFITGKILASDEIIKLIAMGHKISPDEFTVKINADYFPGVKFDE